MSKKSAFVPFVASLGLSLILAACTTDRGVHHFSPSPAARVRSQELEPAKPRLVSELLQSAQKEFEAANAAQEKGDREASIKHYGKMLDLLKEANLDPGAFYNLRAEFERIIGSQAAAPAPDTAAAPPEVKPEGDVQEAFEAANAAQEKGDREAALREYTRMLELLAKEHLNPDAFYSLRSEFERILDTSEKQARLYDRQRANQWKFNQPQPVMGDLDIEYPLSDRVLAEIDEIMNLYPRNFQGGLDRGSKYIPYVKEQFAQAGLPQDLVWLAMVESQFSPKVVSKAGAAGMWQFMKATGDRYGLKVDRYVDDRFNWQESTQAAAQHLSDLYDHFDGNWPLAVSAYNMGENGIDRAVASVGGERNLWKLIETSPASESMQAETKKFYPKLLASIIVAKDPERFGFTSSPQDPEQTARVPVRGSYALSALDRALELPEGALRQLNPDLIRGVTPPSGEFQIAVPAEAAPKLASVLADLPQVRQEVLRAWDKKRIYVARRGDTLESVAKKCGISVADLAKTNRMKPDTSLSSGRKLTIPGGNLDLGEVEQMISSNEKNAANRDENKSEGKTEKKRESGSVMRTYTIKPGDTLETIAKHEKVSLKNLLAWNKIKNQSKIVAGDQLQLTPLAEIQEEQETAETTHVVQAGDSPAKIAKLYGVDLDELLQWNKLSKTTPIHAGDKLVVRGIQEQKSADPPAATAAPDEDAKKIEHKVAKGDTASAIAAKYGVKVSEFLAWNNLTTKSIIREGGAYVVYVKSDKPKADSEKTSTKTKETKVAKADAEKKDDAKKDADTGKKATHVVSKGDSPSTIASRYKVKLSGLYKWNNWGKNVVLQIGQKVTILKD